MWKELPLADNVGEVKNIKVRTTKWNPKYREERRTARLAVEIAEKFAQFPNNHYAWLTSKKVAYQHNFVPR